MLGSGLGGAGRLAGQSGGGPRGLGELPRDALEFAGGAQHLVDDAADAGLEFVDKTAQLGFALLGGGGGGRGLFVAHAAAFDRVVPEHRDGSRNLADLVHPLVAVDLDIGIAVGDAR